MARTQAPRGVAALARVLCAVAMALATTGTAVAEEPNSPQRLETFELPSPLVDTSAPGALLPGGRTVPKVNVLLPAGYDENPDRAYPVLWLLHGANGGADTWASDIETLAAGLPAVVVMPDGGTFGMYMDWWHDGARGNPAWATYHLRLLKDTIESRYRILPERRWHAIGGISMGGQGALRYAGLLPGYFGSVMGFSAALPNMQAPEVQFGLAVLGLVNGAGYQQIFGPATGPYAAGNNSRAIVRNYAHTRMYLTSGNGINCPQDPVLPSFAGDVAIEVVINVQQGLFAHAASGAGADVTARTTCGVHTFGVWDRAFAAARTWGFFEPVEEHPDHWVYGTVAAEGEMWSLDYAFAAPPTTVVTFTRSGDTLSATGSGAVEITGPGDCRITATVPFSRPLPADCP
ncbi:alpha/beta hydrolase [Actinophytocola sp. KF-1]